MGNQIKFNELHYLKEKQESLEENIKQLQCTGEKLIKDQAVWKKHFLLS